MTLEQAIAEFGEQNQKWQSPTRAEGECGYASMKFCDFLEEHGIDARVFDDVEAQGMGFDYIPKYSAHSMVLVEGKTVVDWTAAQFGVVDEWPVVRCITA